jgi:hypothetical protein
VKKQFILDEIERTAEANGGVPLGRARFNQETGIKVSDWAGKFWARWGDAVREAGFDANQLQMPYDAGVLIEKFIEVIRDLGHFPVASEVRLKGHRDASFPSHNTFARFGSKQQFAAKILDYCTGRTGYEDVTALCAPLAKSLQGSAQENTESGEIFGFVYLMKSGRYYKIGRSNAAGRREYELAIQLPEKLNTIHSIRTDDPTGIERYWHRRFEKKRKNGEWFDLSPFDVKAFRRRKFM